MSTASDGEASFLSSVEYLFIAIVLGSTQSWNGSIF